MGGSSAGNDMVCGLDNVADKGIDADSGGVIGSSSKVITGDGEACMMVGLGSLREGRRICRR